MSFIEDILDPPTLTESGDLVSSTGLERLMNQAIRLLMMRKGELLHQPDVGANLAGRVGKPMTDFELQSTQNDGEITLRSMASVEAFSLTLKRGNNELFFDLTISSGGSSLTRRDVRVEG